MHFIWYNPDSREYRHGPTDDFDKEINTAHNPNAFTVLMEFDAGAVRMANKISKQLNLANRKSIVPMAQQVEK